MDNLQRWMQALTDGLGPFAPRLIGAVTILVVAWIAARVVQAAIVRIGTKARLDERLHNPGMSALLANIGRWLVWLFALPALLGTLELKGLLEPVNAMLSRLLGFMPNLFGALVIMGVGLVVAGIVRQIVSGLLQAAGSERLVEKLGLGQALGKQTLAGMAGSLVFALILLPTLAAALDALRIEAVSRPVSQLLEKVFDLIPRLISAAIILGVGALIGRALASVASGVLAGMGINRFAAQLGLKSTSGPAGKAPAGDSARPNPLTRPGGRDASESVGLVVMVGVMFLALTQACEVIGFSVLTDAVATLGLVLARIGVAAVLLAGGLWLGARAADAIRSSGVANALVLAHVARGAILFFTAALALHQAGLPADIITIAFASVIGAVAIAVAVAVGVGGRHVAARLLERAVQSFERQAPQADERTTKD